MTGLGAALLAGHLGLLWLVGSHSTSPTLPDAPAMQFRWVDASLEAPTLAVALLLEDPAFAVEPSIHGFSATGWLTPPPVRTIETEWNEPPRWLEPNLESFGTALAISVTTNRPSSFAESYQPAVDQLLIRPRIASEPIRPQSEWELSPDLRPRLQGEIASPPAWANAELLKDTTLDIAVDAEGLVQSVRLWESSGLPAADQWAMNLAWKLAFAEAPWLPRQTGRFVIRWKTLPSAAPVAPTP